MAIVNMHEAKTQLSRLVQRAEAGKEILIARNDKPVARLVKSDEALPPRVGGTMRGEIWMSDDFNQDDEELNRMFYEGEDPGETRDWPKE